MSDWGEGYVTGLDYTYGYYGELNPLRTAVPLLNAGLAPPTVATACELGFGQGLSLTIHAAASDTSWYGTDFNSAHVGFAEWLAAASGADAHLANQSFAEFCARTDLPDFDFIGLHGVWTWVSAENQRVILDFLRRKLRVGGVLYISYNTLPGAATLLPLRHLLYRHAGVASGAEILPRIDVALEFADRLLALNPGFAVVNPTAAQRLAGIRQLDRHYVAHEYFNREWSVIHFDEMSERLGAARLSYAGSATYLDHVDVLNMTADQQRFLAGIPDPVFRQSVRDFIVNQGFRRDYWVRGARRLLPHEQAAAIRNLRVMLVTPSADVTYTVAGALGQREMAPNIYGPIVDALAEHRVMTLGELERSCGPDARLAAIYEAVMVLIGKGDVVLVQPDETQMAAEPRTRRLNAGILERARTSADLAFLASPVTGGGIAVSRAQQLFLLARQDGRANAEQARFVWDILNSQNQRVMKDGKPLDTAEENLAELAVQAGEFADKRLPALRALGIA